MHNAGRAGSVEFKERVPAHFVTALLAQRRTANPAPRRGPPKLPLKVYGVMAATALLTFVSLVQAYQLAFTHPLYA